MMLLLYVLVISRLNRMEGILVSSVVVVAINI